MLRDSPPIWEQWQCNAGASQQCPVLSSWAVLWGVFHLLPGTHHQWPSPLPSGLNLYLLKQELCLWPLGRLCSRQHFLLGTLAHSLSKLGSFMQALTWRLTLLSGQDTCEGIPRQLLGNSWTKRYLVSDKIRRIYPEGWKGGPASQNRLSVYKMGLQ